MLADVLLALTAELTSEVRILEYLDAGSCRLGDGVDQNTAPTIYLHGDTTDPGCDQRPRLPERLRHDEPKALADRLLDHHVCYGLEGVDLDGPDVREVGEQEDVAVSVGVVDRLVPVVPTLGIVVGHRAYQDELDLGDLLLYEPVGIYYAKGVLPGVEARDLHHKRPLRLNAELANNVAGVVSAQGHVLGRERVYRRGDEGEPGQVHVRRGVLLHGVDLRVVVRYVRHEVVEHVPVGGREIRVAAPDPFRLRRKAPREVLEQGRLRIVDEHDVPVFAGLLECLGRHAVVLFVDRPVFDGKLVLGALQGVVETLGDVEERLRPEHDVPLGLQAGIPHQRYERVQDLGDPTTETRRTDVQDAFPPQTLPEGYYLVVEFPTNYAAIIG